MNKILLPEFETQFSQIVKNENDIIIEKLESIINSQLNILEGYKSLLNDNWEYNAIKEFVEDFPFIFSFYKSIKKEIEFF